MVEAIIVALGGIVGGVSNIVSSSKEAKFGRLPEWLSPRDFQKEDKTLDYTILGVGAVLVVVILAIVFVAVKKK